MKVLSLELVRLHCSVTLIGLLMLIKERTGFRPQSYIFLVVDLEVVTKLP